MKRYNDSRSNNGAKCRISSGVIRYCTAPEELRRDSIPAELAETSAWTESFIENTPAVPDFELEKDPHSGPKTFQRAGTLRRKTAAEAKGK